MKRFNLITIFITTVCLLLLIIISNQSQISFDKFSANPNSATGEPFYTGIIYKLGIVFWSATVIVSLFGFILFKKLSPNEQNPIKYLGYSSLFFGYFLCDELFQLHGTIFPKYIGIKQLLLLIVYSIIAIIYLVKFRMEILKSSYGFLIAAFCLLALSMITDILSYLKIINLSFRYILDDGAKFLGIVNLFLYFINYSLNAVINATQNNQNR